eukprot:s2846_g7.t1
MTATAGSPDGFGSALGFVPGCRKPEELIGSLDADPLFEPTCSKEQIQEEARNALEELPIIGRTDSSSSFFDWTFPVGLPKGARVPPNRILHSRYEVKLDGFLQEVAKDPSKLLAQVSRRRHREFEFVADQRSVV